MTLTVSQLQGWSPSVWQSGQRMVTDRIQVETETAAQLRASAARLEESWQNPNLPVMIPMLIGLAMQHEAWIPTLTEVGTILTDVIRLTSKNQISLTVQLANAASLSARVDDAGYAHMPEGLPAPTTVEEQQERFKLMIAVWRVTTAIREVLVKATGDDTLAAAAIARLCVEELPSGFDGPLDLSDAGIEMAVETNTQDGYGDCSMLANLLGLARANPQWVRDHIQWDAASGMYKVTLYDPNTGQPITTYVDPSVLPSATADQASTNDPTIFSVYEQALRQQFGNEYVTGQTIEHPSAVLTGKGGEYAGPPSAAAARDVLNTQPPGVVVAGPVNQPAGVDPSKMLAPGHAYNVASVDAAGNVTLINPWGPQGGYGEDGHYYPGEVTLTADEYQRWVVGSSTMRQPI